DRGRACSPRGRLLASWGPAGLSRNTAGGPRPRRRTEEPAETTAERRDHCADMVVSALHRCVDASGKLVLCSELTGARSTGAKLAGGVSAGGRATLTCPLACCGEAAGTRRVVRASQP